LNGIHQLPRCDNHRWAGALGSGVPARLHNAVEFRSNSSTWGSPHLWLYSGFNPCFWPGV
jgi:hypothetical protein